MVMKKTLIKLLKIIFRYKRDYYLYLLITEHDIALFFDNYLKVFKQIKSRTNLA